VIASLREENSALETEVIGRWSGRATMNTAKEPMKHICPEHA
jgi:hypothetical protein